MDDPRVRSGRQRMLVIFTTPRLLVIVAVACVVFFALGFWLPRPWNLVAPVGVGLLIAFWLAAPIERELERRGLTSEVDEEPEEPDGFESEPDDGAEEE